MKNKKGMRSFLPKNKKAAEMTIGTIIIIVLALVVLVVLVYGFSTGWTNLWEKITAFGGGEVNVQSVVQSCQLACTTGSRYNYCTLEREVTFGDKEKDADKTKKYTCGELEKDTSMGLDCPAIKCDNPENCEDLEGELVEIKGDVTGCPADKPNKIGSVDTVAGGGEISPVWCCR